MDNSKKKPAFREKLTHYGADEMKLHELIAIILNTGLRGKSTIEELSEQLLESYGNNHSDLNS